MTNENMRALWNSPETIKGWRATEVGASELTAPLLNALMPVRGERMLDVGCGGGLPTIEAALAVAPDGHVTGADISNELLTLAQERATQANVSNISFINADVQVEDLPGAPFDAVFSRLGVMFFSDPIAAFTNIRRHMKPGARLVFICLQDFIANDWYPSEILAKYEPPRAPSRFTPPSPYALGDKSYTAGILGEAGFAGTSFDPLSFTSNAPYESASAAVARLIVPLDLSPEVAAIALAELQAHVGKYVTNGRHVTQRKSWIVRASNPN